MHYTIRAFVTENGCLMIEMMIETMEMMMTDEMMKIMRKNIAAFVCRM